MKIRLCPTKPHGGSQQPSSKMVDCTGLPIHTSAVVAGPKTQNQGVLPRAFAPHFGEVQHIASRKLGSVLQPRWRTVQGYQSTRRLRQVPKLKIRLSCQGLLPPILGRCYTQPLKSQVLSYNQDGGLRRATNPHVGCGKSQNSKLGYVLPGAFTPHFGGGATHSLSKVRLCLTMLYRGLLPPNFGGFKICTPLFLILGPGELPLGGPKWPPYYLNAILIKKIYDWYYNYLTS